MAVDERVCSRKFAPDVAPNSWSRSEPEMAPNSWRGLQIVGSRTWLETVGSKQAPRKPKKAKTEEKKTKVAKANMSNYQQLPAITSNFEQF